MVRLLQGQAYQVHFGPITSRQEQKVTIHHLRSFTLRALGLTPLILGTSRRPCVGPTRKELLLG